MPLRLQLFYSPYCPRCRQARALLQSVVADQHAEDLQLEELDVLQELDRAVTAGILRTPALLIDGELLTGPIPTRGRIEALLRQWRMARRRK